MLKFRAIHVTSPHPQWVYALASAMIALGAYLLTLAPDLTWANTAIDGGELITASATLGVPHPPGYPTYVLLGKLFGFLPLGTVAFRYNLFSALCMAAAVGLLALTIGALQPRVRPPAAMAAALLFGFAPLVWSQAIVAEVYSLNLLMMAAFLLAWARRGASARSGLWLGLAITTHLTALLLLPAFLIRGRRRWRYALIGIGVGLIPLLLLPLLAGGDSPVVWGRPLDAAGWWWLVSGRLYAANLRPEYDPQRVAELLWALALGPAALIGAGRAANLARPTSSATAAANDTRPTTGALAGTAALYMLFALSYATPDAAVLLLPALMMAALLIAPWLDRLGAAALLLPLLLAVSFYPAMNLRHETGPRTVAERLLIEAPQNALLLTPGDRTIFTLLYFQQVEGQRPDLRIVDANLFAFDWYRARLGRQYPDVAVPEGDDLTALQNENSSTRPFCLAGLVSWPANPDAAGGSSGQTIPPPYLDCTGGSR